jgi:hypothetical protein
MLAGVLPPCGAEKSSAIVARTGFCPSEVWLVILAVPAATSGVGSSIADSNAAVSSGARSWLSKLSSSAPNKDSSGEPSSLATSSPLCWVFSSMKIPANMPAPPAAALSFPTASSPFWVAVDRGVETIFGIQALHSSLELFKSMRKIS